MSHKVEIRIEDDVHKLIKKMSEAGRHGKPCTIAEMAGDLVHTGVFRRIAANKWAKAHPSGKPSKRKATKKVVKAKSPKAPKVGKKPSKKPATVRKAKVKAPAPVLPPAAVEPTAAASPALLD